MIIIISYGAKKKLKANVNVQFSGNLLQLQPFQMFLVSIYYIFCIFQKRKLLVGEYKKRTVLALPYSGDRFTMYLILPHTVRYCIPYSGDRFTMYLILPHTVRQCIPYSGDRFTMYLILPHTVRYCIPYSGDKFTMYLILPYTVK